MDINDYHEKTERVDTTPANTEWEASLDDLFGDLFSAFADVLVPSMVKTELDEQRKLIESKDYCSAILRQAAFVESLLEWGMIEEIESYQGRELSNSEQEAIERLGNTPTVYFANALGILNDSEYEAYTKLMSVRNSVAHNWWLLISDEDQEYYEHVTTRVFQTLENAFEDINF
ncbi:hypothetical protein [Halorubrum tebenquichense]|uniref:hypothetical protein n=1 Tax=Halorubrum tebenquichense TaxID=119434 RepID=UPI0012691C23|nr:hypothetical protein [Halorubrum tebenquichense]